MKLLQTEHLSPAVWRGPFLAIGDKNIKLSNLRHYFNRYEANCQRGGDNEGERIKKERI